MVILSLFVALVVASCALAEPQHHNASATADAETVSEELTSMESSFSPMFCSHYKCKSKCDCGKSKCYKQMGACYKDKQCKSAYECLGKCSCSDVMCAMSCKRKISKETSASKTFLSCLKSHCSSESESESEAETVSDGLAKDVAANASKLVLLDSMNAGALGPLNSGQVWHIMPATLSDGVTEKNAGNEIGELGFLFADGTGGLRARGCKDYFNNGVVEMVFINVPGQFGPYERCNHDGNYVYTCAGGGSYPGARPPVTVPGTEQDFSFPRSGEGQTWSQSTKIQVSASTLISGMGAAAGCSCSSQATCDECGQCFLVAFNPSSITPGGKGMGPQLVSRFRSYFGLSSLNSTDIIV